MDPLSVNISTRRPTLSAQIDTRRPVIAANLEELRYLVFHGMQGDAGESAYDLAVSLGFDGTEAQWLASLVGPQGEQGEPGPRGERGPAGEAGPDGKNYGMVVDGSVDHVLELKAVEAAGTISIDDVPTENSGKAVSSGGVYTALAGKADTDVVHTALANGSGLYNLVNAMTVPGFVSYANGSGQSSDNYLCTPFLYFPKGTKLEVKGFANAATIASAAVYDGSRTYIQASSVAGTGRNSSPQLFRFTMPVDGYVRFSCHRDAMTNAVIRNITAQKELNILVLGNSFSQDAFAYLPPVLNELLPDYAITYGVAYTASCGAIKHLELYQNDQNYDNFHLWRPGADHWSRYAGTGIAGYSLRKILAFCDWDVVYMQSRGSIAADEMEQSMMEQNITPGQEFLSVLQAQIGGTFTFLTGQWLSFIEKSTGDTLASYFRMRKAMRYVSDRLGVDGVIPIGAGIAFARMDAALDALGDRGHMVQDDHGHQQAGLPALISTYVIAQYILAMLGRENVSVYGSTFVPSAENVSALNAGRMTHGDPVGVTAENIRKAQEIAVAAAAHPDSVYGAVQDPLAGLAAVAVSGSYSDLSDRPNIPAAVTIDAAPAENSANAVSSGGVYAALQNLQGGWADISEGVTVTPAVSTDQVAEQKFLYHAALGVVHFSLKCKARLESFGYADFAVTGAPPAAADKMPPEQAMTCSYQDVTGRQMVAASATLLRAGTVRLYNNSGTAGAHYADGGWFFISGFYFTDAQGWEG